MPRNPGCEETAERLMFAAPGRNARITRELSMLGPAVLQMLGGGFRLFVSFCDILIWRPEPKVVKLVCPEDNM